MSIPFEVIIYVNKVKQYFDSNDETKKYFHIDEYESYFFDELSDIARKNYDEKQDPMLSIEQFEEIRLKILSKIMFKNIDKTTDLPFTDLNLTLLTELSKICLN
jgi:uncharacterized protein (UPF0305 family)